MNEEIIREIEHYLISCGRAQATLKSYRGVLNKFSISVDGDIRFANKEQVLDFISEKGYSDVTRGIRYYTLKKFYQWLIESRKILLNPMATLPPPKAPKKLPSKIMTVGETKKVLDVIKADNENIFNFRDRVIMELMYSCSLRRSDVGNLLIKDYDPATRSLRVKGSRTKTNVGRVVPVGQVSAELLEKYLKEVRPLLLKDNQIEAIFLNYKGNQLSLQRITKMANDARKKANIRTKATSHSFRKSSATHMLRAGAPLISVQALLGHVEATSTQIYTKIYPRDLIKMHRARHPREKQKNQMLPDLKVPKMMHKGWEIDGPRMKGKKRIRKVSKAESSMSETEGLTSES